MIGGSDLFLAGTDINDLRDESGAISADLVANACREVVRAHPHWGHAPAAPSRLVRSGRSADGIRSTESARREKRRWPYEARREPSRRHPPPLVSGRPKGRYEPTHASSARRWAADVPLPRRLALALRVDEDRHRHHLGHRVVPSSGVAGVVARVGLAGAHAGHGAL